MLVLELTCLCLEYVVLFINPPGEFYLEKRKYRR